MEKQVWLVSVKKKKKKSEFELMRCVISDLQKADRWEEKQNIKRETTLKTITSPWLSPSSNNQLWKIHIGRLMSIISEKTACK